MTHLKQSVALIAASILFLASPVSAREELNFDQEKEWEHPHGALTMPVNLAGLSRQRGIAFSDDILDIGVIFSDGQHEATLYVFRKTNGSAPIWFTQAHEAILARDIYDKPSLFEEIEPISPGQSNVPLGLKGVYRPGEDSRASSTGLVVFEMGEWYVKLRFSSYTFTVEQASEWIDLALSELAIGDVPTPNSVIAPIANCPTELEYKNRTRDAKTDGAAAMLSGLFDALVVEELEDAIDEGNAPETPIQWCRDRFIEPGKASYRNIESDNSYLLAMGDNGSAISVGPDNAATLLSDAAEQEKDTRYSVTLIQESRNFNFTAQDRFPSPKRVLKIFEKGNVVSSISTWGDDSTIEINSDSL